MRFARAIIIVCVPVALAGCLTEGSHTRWLNPFPLLRPSSDTDTALVQYVVIERTAGTEEINRRAWDRVDEQILPYETRVLLEDAGLRVGSTTESAPGVMRKLIEDPRTALGHRGRTFALDKAAPLQIGGILERAEFTIPGPEGGRINFARDAVALGFDMSVRDSSDGKVVVKLVPRARYADSTKLLTADIGDRGQSTQTFPAAGFEVALAPSDYLVVGTDSFWEGTFGSQAMIGDKDERRVQRLLVLRASLTKAGQPAVIAPSDVQGQAAAPPLASQASTFRGARP